MKCFECFKCGVKIGPGTAYINVKGNWTCKHCKSENLTARFDACVTSSLNAERAADYGHPLDNFRRIAAMKAVTAECPDPEIREALNMIVTKVSRLIHKPDHFDSIVDIAGYARTILMVLDRRRRDHDE